MSATCPHCARLRDERDEAREEVLQLRAELASDFSVIAGLMRRGFTPSEAQIVGVLLAREVASVDAIAAVLYTDADYVPDAKNVIATLLCNARPRLGALGVVVENVRGIGWRLSAEAKACVRVAIDLELAA